jgi:O-antigen ligase
VVGALAAVKAGTIYFTEFWAIGSFDRLQASLGGSADQLRVILVGGDTLLVIVPALATLAALSRPRLAPVWLALLIAAMAVGAVLISGTRTSLPITLLIAAGVAVVVRRRQGGVEVTPRLLVTALLCAVALAGGAIGSGVADRFQTADAPHVGINFRLDELRSFYDLPTVDLLAGQGFGGRFPGKDVNGAPVTAGWAHAYPVWVQLKAGLVGLIAALGLLVLALRRARIGWQSGGRAQTEAVVGATLLISVLAMSMTLGRAGLPEGVVLLALGAVMIYRPADTRS